MPLSEQEQRLLEEMERSLYHNDADFVATVSRSGRPNYTMIVVGILVAVLGIAGVVTGVAIRQPLVGVFGFIVMFAGVLLALSRPRASGSSESPAPARQRSRAGFMDRMNERWDKRQEGHGN